MGDVAVRVLIRAAAGPSVGAGHAMRCLALAQALRRLAAPPVFVVDDGLDWVLNGLTNEGFTVVAQTEKLGSATDARFTRQLAGKHEVERIVLDGYPFGVDYQSELAVPGWDLAVIDDLAANGSELVDMIVDPNLHADPSVYERSAPYAIKLIGPRFALLRDEFSAVGPSDVVEPEVRNVLVAVGGGEASAAVSLGRDALALVDPRPDVSFIGPVDVAGQMRGADLALATASTVSWELSYLGVPFVCLAVADNQEPVGRSLDKAGVSRYLGRLGAVTATQIAEAVTSLMSDAERRREMSRRGRSLVDGMGAQRVARALVGHSRQGPGQEVRLRRAVAADADVTFPWATDAETMRNRISKDEITPQGHRDWFRSLLERPADRVWIAEGPAGGRRVALGQIRVDATGEIHLVVAPAMRGQGFAVPMIRGATQRACYEAGWDVLHAHVLPDNIASLRSFERAGYVREGHVEVRGVPCIRFRYEAPQ